MRHRYASVAQVWAPERWTAVPSAAKSKRHRPQTHRPARLPGATPMPWPRAGTAAAGSLLHRPQVTDHLDIQTEQRRLVHRERCRCGDRHVIDEHYRAGGFDHRQSLLNRCECPFNNEADADGLQAVLVSAAQMRGALHHAVAAGDRLTEPVLHRGRDYRLTGAGPDAAG